jgi:kanamycin kinase
VPLDREDLLGFPDLGADVTGVTEEPFYENEAGALTYQLVGERGAWFLKVIPAGQPSAEGEASRMRWARAWLPVPHVVATGTTRGGGSWLLTAALPGTDATRTRLRSDRERLAIALARGLRRFHEAPVEDCPFPFRLDEALALAQQRIRGGIVVPERHFHPEHLHLSADAALQLLLRSRPTTEDLVVCHGDYCLPNALLDGDEVVGFVDLGGLGVADRWWDLAVATWSLTWNLGPGLEDAFLAAYGTPRDDARQRFYRLLYDVVA